METLYPPYLRIELCQRFEAKLLFSVFVVYRFLYARSMITFQLLFPFSTLLRRHRHYASVTVDHPSGPLSPKDPLIAPNGHKSGEKCNFLPFSFVCV